MQMNSQNSRTQMLYLSFGHDDMQKTEAIVAHADEVKSAGLECTEQESMHQVRTVVPLCRWTIKTAELKCSV